MTADQTDGRDRRVAGQAIVNRLLDTHAALAAASAVARAHGLTRCTDSLTRQTSAIAHEIQTLVADLLYPTTVATEARR
jgi:hypothetical protein